MPRVPAYDLFSSHFGFSVNVQRADRISFDVVPLATVENQVGRKENEGNVRRQFGQQFRNLNIQFASEDRVLLTGRSFGERCAVENQLWLILRKQPPNGTQVGEIELRTNQAADFRVWTEGGSSMYEIIANQS